MALYANEGGVYIFAVTFVFIYVQAIDELLLATAGCALTHRTKDIGQAGGLNIFAEIGLD